MDTSNSTPNMTPKTLMERIRSRRLTTTFILLATFSVGILAGSVLTHGVSGKEQAIDSSDARPLVIPSPSVLSNGFSEIVKRDGPAVVNINTESLPKQSTNKTPKRRGQRGQQQPGGDDQPNQGDMQDFFNRFFGGQGGGDGDEDGPAGAERRALGSGFIVDSRGYIITNNHVVDKADKIYVKLSTDPEGGENGRPATVIGVDKDTDIAVIKIDTSGLKEPLHTIKLGNSDSAQVGDWVLAIGSPFGLSQTVSAGIVSAKNRSIDEPSPNGVSQSQFQRFIQTDAAINPGNSGGPLVDMAGNVVGMNTAIYTQSMGSQGVGFAMPSNIIASVYNMLIGPDHKVTRGSIGISFQPAVSSAVGRMYGFTNGVIVATVSPSGGAAKAGLQPGDVITSIDGRNIKDGDDLVNDISARKVGSSVKLGYIRSGKPGTANVAIGDRAKTYAELTGADADDSPAPQESDAGQSTLGITVSAVPASVLKKLNLPGGVMVTTVRPGSFADEIGLGKGVIITAINKMPVTDESSYKALVSRLKSKDDVVFVVTAPTRPGNTYVGGTLP